jgi:hypothetical protein
VTSGALIVSLEVKTLISLTDGWSRSLNHAVRASEAHPEARSIAPSWPARRPGRVCPRSHRPEPAADKRLTLKIVERNRPQFGESMILTNGQHIWFGEEGYPQGADLEGTCEATPSVAGTLVRNPPRCPSETAIPVTKLSKRSSSRLLSKAGAPVQAKNLAARALVGM